MAHEKILVTEDEEKISRIIKSYLEKEGFSVSVASTGQKALELIHRGFDLVILDRMLPDVEGETVCTEIRRFSDVPIIILTAKSSEDERVRGLGLGADDYVVKPFSPRELVARVKAHLRRKKGKEEQVLSFNGGLLQIHIAAMEVKRGDELVDLTKTEFNILLYLAQRAQTVIPRLQIINNVLGYEFEGYDRVIDAHIKNIRRKIEENPQAPLFIRTIYGAGYKFVGKADD
jgi:DNA-binding response OmpR family regulator